MSALGRTPPGGRGLIQLPGLGSPRPSPSWARVGSRQRIETPVQTRLWLKRPRRALQFSVWVAEHLAQRQCVSASPGRGEIRELPPTAVPAAGSGPADNGVALVTSTSAVRASGEGGALPGRSKATRHRVRSPRCAGRTAPRMRSGSPPEPARARPQCHSTVSLHAAPRPVPSASGRAACVCPLGLAGVASAEARFPVRQRCWWWRRQLSLSPPPAPSGSGAVGTTTTGGLWAPCPAPVTAEATGGHPRDCRSEGLR